MLRNFDRILVVRVGLIPVTVLSAMTSLSPLGCGATVGGQPIPTGDDEGASELVGQSCKSGVTDCAPGTFFSEDRTCDEFVAGLGDHCAYARCAFGLTCDSGNGFLCQKSAVNVCADGGAGDAAPGQCLPPGEACGLESEATPCCAGTTCTEYTVYDYPRCLPRSPVGTFCTGDNQCASWNCQDSRCAARP